MALPWDFHALDSDGFRLDRLRPDDLDDLYALQSDPEVCRYLLYEPRSYKKVTEVLARDRAATRLDEKDSYIQPAIRTPDGRLVGTMYLNIASVEDRAAEIG